MSGCRMPDFLRHRPNLTLTEAGKRKHNRSFPVSAKLKARSWRLTAGFWLFRCSKVASQVILKADSPLK